MANHLSISPMTMSMLPTMAGTSAMRQPRQISLVTLRLQKLDDRARTRSGTAILGVPADDVEAHLAARALRLDVGLARRQVTRRLDAVRALGRRRSARSACSHDLDALDHLQHAHVEAVPAVAEHAPRAGASRERRHDRLEVVGLVAAVRLDLAQVPVRVALRRGRASRAASARCSRSSRASSFDRMPMLGRALDEDVVARQQRVILLDARLEVVEELLAALDPALGRSSWTPPMVM